jgi:16S rRNA (guanine527-N7)-methyltransferase
MVDRLAAVLDRARTLGFLGPGPVAGHIDHARAFEAAWHLQHEAPPVALLDLGAGGGVPGLVLGCDWPGSRTVLLDAAQRRCDFLTVAIEELGLVESAEVYHDRAEAAARTPALEGAFDLVTARSFGQPAVTAECAARFLAPGGVLIVSEPPDGQRTHGRWSHDGLSLLGLGPAVPTSGEPHLVVIPRRQACPAQYPRRDGVPSKRPLF